MRTRALSIAMIVGCLLPFVGCASPQTAPPAPVATPTAPAAPATPAARGPAPVAQATVRVSRSQGLGNLVEIGAARGYFEEQGIELRRT